MRRYLLDTSIVVGLLNGSGPIAELTAPAVRRDEASTSILAYGEVMEHIMGRVDVTARLRGFRSLMRNIQLISVTRDVAETYGSLRRQLRPPYGPGLIGDIDTLIAATAVVRDLTLVTTDSDFLRVPDLRVQHIERHR